MLPMKSYILFALQVSCCNILFGIVMYFTQVGFTLNEIIEHPFIYAASMLLLIGSGCMCGYIMYRFHRN